MKKLFFFFSILFVFISIYAEEYIYEIPTDLAWSRELTVDSTAIPSNFTNANLKGSVNLFPGNDSGLFIYLQGRAPWWPEVYTNKLCYSDSSGNIKELKNKYTNLLNKREPYLIKGKNDLYILFNDTIIKSDNKGDFELLKLKTGTVFDLQDDKHIMLCYNDSGKKLMGKSIPYLFEYSAILYETQDFKKLTQFCLLPVSSDILNEAAIAANKENYAVMLNNTILRGPDHHDLNIYMIGKNFNKIWEHHITGKSALGRILGDDIVIDSAGNITVIGFSNDINVSFRDSNEYDQAYPDFFSNPCVYYFITTYNKKGELIKLHKFMIEEELQYRYNKFKILSGSNENLVFYNEWKPEIYVYNKIRDKITRYKVNIGLNEAKLQQEIRILFINSQMLYVAKIQNGPLNTSHSPVFKIEKRTIPFAFYYEGDY